MYFCIPIQKSRQMHVWLAVSLFLASSAHCTPAPERSAQDSSQDSRAKKPSIPQQEQGAQQPANSATSQQPGTKRKKVWTNDDVISLRTPADKYLAEKEAQEAVATEIAAKKAAEAKRLKEAGLTETLPSTLEETRALVAAKEAQVAEDQQVLDRYTAELPTEPAEHKDRMQAEIERVTSELPKERLALKVLQDHLQQLTKAKLNEAPAPPATPPPS